MFKAKKLFAAGIALAMTVALAVPAMAVNVGKNSKTVPGYGTLYGSLSVSGAYVTSVTTNPDQAILTIAGTIQNLAGETLVEQKTIESNKGATYFNGYWTYIPANAYALYGAHGIQGGGTYDAQVVYTVTHVTA